MSSTDMETEAELQANELYWHSELSVNQIAEELDLSKGTLYGIIRPKSAGLSCPECSEELLYPNRTARDRGMVACAVCGWEGAAEDGEAYGGDGGVTLPAQVAPDRADPPSRLEDARTRTIIGGALLGAAAGLALVFWARRR